MSILFTTHFSLPSTLNPEEPLFVILCDRKNKV
jgi:hypothetical protein